MELSIVVPTYNEVQNVRVLYEKLVEALPDVRWEIIFVDDNSPDKTADEARSLATEKSNVRCLQRIGRRGLSSACVEGALSSAAPYIAVMDGDLQHDETILPRMLQSLRDGADCAIGSRYVDGGGVGDWDETRSQMSALSTRLAKFLTNTPVADPLSGFFMMRSEIWRENAADLSSIGFKILLDLLATSRRPLKVVEVPFVFRTRQFGDSKLDNSVAWDFIMMLLDKKVGHLVPVRFLSFAFIGGFGVFVHMAVLTLLWSFGSGFLPAHITATLVAMTSNFFLNNMLTYKDKALKGWQLLTGWVTFCLASGLGAVGNVGVGNWVREADYSWTLSATAGILVGVVWNYVMTRTFTWRQ